MKKLKGKEAKGEMFTTTISLPPEIHLKLRHLALDEGKTMRDLIRKAIDEYLARGKEKGGGKR